MTSSDVGLGRIHRINIVIWLVGTLALLVLKIDWGLAFGYGGLLGFLNFSVLGSLVKRFLGSDEHSALWSVGLGAVYIGRLGLVFVLIAAGLLWLKLSPIALAAGLGTILMASVADAVVNAVKMHHDDEE